MTPKGLFALLRARHLTRVAVGYHAHIDALVACGIRRDGKEIEVHVTGLEMAQLSKRKLKRDVNNALDWALA